MYSFESPWLSVFTCKFQALVLVWYKKVRMRNKMQSSRSNDRDWPTNLASISNIYGSRVQCKLAHNGTFFQSSARINGVLQVSSIFVRTQASPSSTMQERFISFLSEGVMSAAESQGMPLSIEVLLAAQNLQKLLLPEQSRDHGSPPEHLIFGCHLRGDLGDPEACVWSEAGADEEPSVAWSHASCLPGGWTRSRHVCRTP